MGGQQNIGSPSGAFPQAPQPATGSSILWQWLEPHLVSLFNQQPGQAMAQQPMPDSASGAQVAPSSAQTLQGTGSLPANAQDQPWQISHVVGDPAAIRHQMRELDKQLKAGQQPDPDFLTSLIQQGAIWQEEDGGWSGILPRSGAQSQRLVKAMDAFSDYLAQKGLPPPRQLLPTIGYLGQIPPDGQ